MNLSFHIIAVLAFGVLIWLLVKSKSELDFIRAFSGQGPGAPQWLLTEPIALLRRIAHAFAIPWQELDSGGYSELAVSKVHLSCLRSLFRNHRIDRIQIRTHEDSTGKARAHVDVVLRDLPPVVEREEMAQQLASSLGDQLTISMVSASR